MGCNNAPHPDIELGFVLLKERLAKPLARSDTRVRDLDIPVRFKASQHNHASGKVINADGLTHVEDEDG